LIERVREEGIGVRTLWIGALVWALFCVIGVIARGVRWDDNLEFAQILLGWVQYPEGHPRLRYVHGVFSLQTWSSAGILWLTQSDAALCAFRNWLFLLATVVPVFLLGAILGRSVISGHAAAVFELIGIHTLFDNQYPIFTWPGLFSYGHIGTGVSVLILWAFAAQRWRTAYLLLGLMPAIHLGQVPVALGLGGVGAIWLWWTSDEGGGGRKLTPVIRALILLLPGILVCIALVILQKTFAVPAATTGPYAVTGDATAIWQNYTTYYDTHRRILPGNHHLGMAIAVVMASLMLRDEISRGVRGGAWMWVWLYVCGVATLVWGITIAHLMLGVNTPFLLLSWMPYRLANHSSTILVPMVCGMLTVSDWRREKTATDATFWPRILIVLAILFVTIKPIIEPVIGGALYSRYFSQWEIVTFALIGCACARWFDESLLTNRARNWLRVFGVLALVMLAFFHRYGAACTTLGVAGYWGFRIILDRKTFALRSLAPFFYSACCLAVAAAIHQEWRRYEFLPKPEFDSKVSAYLHERNEENALIAVEPTAWYPQVRLNHPIFLDMDMVSHIMYMPELGATICRMYHDVYGMRYDLPPEVRPSWKEIWKARTIDEWREIASKFNIEYVISPTDTPLNFPALLSDPDFRMYRLPDVN
jgi:hypothetical protein